MNPLTNTRNITKLNERELALGISERASWHNEYKDSAWIFVGGLSYDLTEGDLLCVFSQYGEIVNINLVRDKKTGKTLGYGFICYEDQRSTVLAVDNLNAIKLCNRTIRVDHVNNYRMPKQDADLDPMTQAIREKGCAPAIMPDMVKLASGLAEDAANRPIKQEVIDLEPLPISAAGIKREKPDRNAADSWRNGGQTSSSNDRHQKDRRHDDTREERSRDKRQRTFVTDESRDRESKKHRTEEENGDELRARKSRKYDEESENANGRRDRRSKRSRSPESSGESGQKIRRRDDDAEKNHKSIEDRSVERERRRRSREKSPVKEKRQQSHDANVELEYKSSEKRSKIRSSHKLREPSPTKESPKKHRKQSKKQKHKSRRKSCSSEESSGDTDSSHSPESPPTKSNSNKLSKHRH